MGYTGSANAADHRQTVPPPPPPPRRNRFVEAVGDARTATSTARRTGNAHSKAEAEGKWRQVQTLAEGDFRLAAASAPDEAGAAEAIRRKKLELQALAGGDERQIYASVLDAAEQTIRDEKPAQRKTRVTLDDTQGRLATASAQWQTAQGWTQAQRQASPELQRQYDAAKTGYVQAETDMATASNAVIDADLDARLRKLYGDGGTYTRQQVETAAGELKAAYGGDADTGKLVDYRAAVHVQGSAAQEWLDKIRSDPDALKLTDAERKLAEKDPVTLAFVKAAGVTLELDPAKDKTLSAEEIALGNEDPVLFTFMKLGKVDFAKDGNNIRVSIAGKPHTLTQEQRAAFEQGGTTALALSLSGDIDLGMNAQALMEASDTVRLRYASAEMAGKSGADALAFVNAQLPGFFSATAREAFWSDTALPVIKPYLQSGIDGVKAEKGFEQAYLTTLGQYLNGALKDASPEVANLILDLTKDRVDRLSPDDSISSSSVFLQALSHAVHIADQAPGSDRAGEIADWLVNSELGLVNRKTASDLLQIIGTTGDAELGNALLDKVEASDVYVDGFADEMKWGVTEGEKQYSKEHSETARKAAYDAFMDPKFHAEAIQGYLDKFLGSPNIGVPVSTQNSPALRNTVGQALGAEPTQNPDAAKAGDLSVDWYAQGTPERATIDLIVSWIDRKDDTGSTVTALPIIYASRRDGVEYGALFKITKADGSEVVIDGNVADDAFLIAADQNGIDPSDSQKVYNQDLTQGDDTLVDWSYDSFDNFVDSNHYDEDGKIYMPTDWRIADADGDHHVDWVEKDAARTTTGEKWRMAADVGALVVGTVGGLLLAPVTGGSSLIATGAVWTAVGVSAGWQIYRAQEMRDEMTAHGQTDSWSNPNVRDTYIQQAAGVFSIVPLGAGARAITLGKTGTRLELAERYAQVAKQTGRVNTAAGVYFLTSQGTALVANWGSMSTSERAMGLTFTLFGASQFGVGMAASRMPRIARALSARSELPPTALQDPDASAPATVPARIGQLADTLWQDAGSPEGQQVSYYLQARNRVRTSDRAYGLWEQTGRVDGQDAAHWTQAEGEIAASQPPGMRYTRFDAARGEPIVFDTGRPRGDRVVPLDTPFTGNGLQLRIHERAYLLWEAAGSPQGRDVDFWQQAETQIRAEADIAVGQPYLPRGARPQAASVPPVASPGPWPRVQAADIGDTLFFDPISQRSYSLNHDTGKVRFYRRPGEAANDLPVMPAASRNMPAIAAGTRFYSERFNRDFVYNAVEGRFDPLDAGGAEVYFHAQTNQTFIRNADGGLDYWGLGDNRADTSAPSRLPGGPVPTTPPDGVTWYYDRDTNRSYTVDYRTGRFRPLDPAAHLTHYDAAANRTYIIDQAKGRTAFFGEGDNRAGRTSLDPLPDLSLPGLQKRLPDIRAGFAVRGRVKPLDTTGGPTMVAVGVSVGTETNFRIIREGFAQSRRTRSPRPALKAMGDQLQISIRPREFRNIPLSQWGIIGVSRQTAFQYKGSKLLEGATNVLTGKPEESAFNVKVLKARPVGRQQNGPHSVVELSVSLSLKSADKPKMAAGETDIFGTPAQDEAGFVFLPKGAPFEKVMTELKVSQPFWAKILPIKVGFEARPELTLKNGIPQGVVVSRRFLEQNDAMLSQTDLRVQLVVTDPLAVKALEESPSLALVQRLVAEGKIDTTTSVAYVPGAVRSGLRLSAVVKNEAYKEMTDLTGRTRRVWHEGQSNLDVIFNDAYRGPLRRVPNIDRTLDRLSYPLEQRMANTPLPRWLEKTPLRRLGTGAPQPHYLPIEGSIYEPFGAARGNAATRYTLSFSTPTFIRLGSAEFRVSWKSKPDAKAPSPTLTGTDQVGFMIRDAGGTLAVYHVPAWFAEMPQRAQRGEGVLMPVGGRKMLEESILPELGRDATPAQQNAIRLFREQVLPKLKEGEFIPPAHLNDIDGFLRNYQAG